MKSAERVLKNKSVMDTLRQYGQMYVDGAALLNTMNDTAQFMQKHKAKIERFDWSRTDVKRAYATWDQVQATLNYMLAVLKKLKNTPPVGELEEVVAQFMSFAQRTCSRWRNILTAIITNKRSMVNDLMAAMAGDYSAAVKLSKRMRRFSEKRGVLNSIKSFGVGFGVLSSTALWHMFAAAVQALTSSILNVGLWMWNNPAWKLAVETSTVTSRAESWRLFKAWTYAAEKAARAGKTAKSREASAIAAQFESMFNKMSWFVPSTEARPTMRVENPFSSNSPPHGFFTESFKNWMSGEDPVSTQAYFDQMKADYTLWGKAEAYPGTMPPPRKDAGPVWWLFVELPIKAINAVYGKLQSWLTSILKPLTGRFDMFSSTVTYVVTALIVTVVATLVVGLTLSVVKGSLWNALSWSMSSADAADPRNTFQCLTESGMCVRVHEPFMNIDNGRFYASAVECEDVCAIV